MFSAIGRAYDGCRMTRTSRTSTFARTCRVCAGRCSWPLTASWISTRYGNSARRRQAVSLALIIDELMTDAAECAFSDRSDGRIWVRLVRPDGTLLICARPTASGCPLALTQQEPGSGNADDRGTFKAIGGCHQPSRGCRWDKVVLMVPLQTVTESMWTSLRCLSSWRR